MRISFNLLPLFMVTTSIAATATTTVNTPRCGTSSSTITTAQVLQGNTLCKQEVAAYALRQTKAQTTLSNLLNQTIKTSDVPSIGVACSGGGFRAALATLGLIRGLAAIGVLDAVSYWAALSGSTWATASWIYHNTTLDTLTSYLQHKLDTTSPHDNIDEDAITSTLVNKIANGRPYSLNDVWGSIIANMVLGDAKDSAQKVLFSSLASRVASGAYPIPLFTNIIGETSPNYEWFETSPFLAGSTYLKTWIPTTAFGKKFNAGNSTDALPEETLGFILGMCGSAYAVSMSDIIENIDEAIQAGGVSSLFSCLNSKNANKGKVKDKRISPPVINNFTYNLQGAPLSNKSTITLVDAGIEINLPFAPLLRRGVNLYIICDADTDNLSVLGNEMHEIEAWAESHNYPFPAINYQQLTTQKLSICFDQNNPQAPIIIYIPNHVQFSTLKFSYTTDEFNSIVGGMEKTVKDNAQQIYQAIGLAVANKRAVKRL